MRTLERCDICGSLYFENTGNTTNDYYVCPDCTRQARINNKFAKSIEAMLWPMGVLTFSISCWHCKNRDTEKCKACREMKESGFEIDHKTLKEQE